MSDPASRRVRLRGLIEAGETLLVPGAANALTARLIEDAGFTATYVTGAGIANTYLGVPDIGLLSLTELAAHVTAISAAVETPLIVDADTGFGNALNVRHSVQTLERAGASAIQIEDQTFPKRCGHFEGKTTVSLEDMVQKVRAAVDARQDPNLLIVARTDARAEFGLEEACQRARAYREAGADLTFVEAPESEAEIEYIGKQVPGPKVLNIVQGGRTPELALGRVHELGFAVVLYANLPLVVSTFAVRSLLETLKEDGHSRLAPPAVTFQERQAIVRKPLYEELDERYSPVATRDG